MKSVEPYARERKKERQLRLPHIYAITTRIFRASRPGTFAGCVISAVHMEMILRYYHWLYSLAGRRML